MLGLLGFQGSKIHPNTLWFLSQGLPTRALHSRKQECSPCQARAGRREFLGGPLPGALLHGSEPPLGSGSPSPKVGVSYTIYSMYIHICIWCIYIYIYIYVQIDMYVWYIAYIYIYGSPPPLIHIFWPLQPTQAGFPQHLMINQVSGFKDTLPLSAIPGGGPP